MARKVNHDKRRQEIANRALRLFSQVGYDNVSLSMIAATSGISRTVIYRYFCSKREVMDAAILEKIEVIKSRCLAILRSKGTAPEKLERVCHAVVEVMFEHREFFIAIFNFLVEMVRGGADMNQGIREFTGGTRNTVRMLVAHGARNGDFPGIASVDAVSDAVYGELESCAVRIVMHAEDAPGAAKRRISELVRAIALRK